MSDEVTNRVSNMSDEALKERTQLYDTFIRDVEKRNLQRINNLLRIRRRNLFTGIGLAVFVGCVYTYSILAVRQEKFLDEIVEIDMNKVVTDKLDIDKLLNQPSN